MPSWKKIWYFTMGLGRIIPAFIISFGAGFCGGLKAFSVSILVVSVVLFLDFKRYKTNKSFVAGFILASAIYLVWFIGIFIDSLVIQK